MPVANKFLNGVDVSRMQETIEAVAAKPALGKFTFRVANRWLDGAENRTETRDFNAGGQVRSLTSPRSCWTHFSTVR